MDTLELLVMVILGWLAVVGLAHLVIIPWLARRPLRGDPVVGAIWHMARTWCRLVHRATYHNTRLLPEGPDERGLVVICNHTGAIDPFLVSAACPFFIRWMMASDMMSPGLARLWKRLRVISVNRFAGDSAGLRATIKHVRSGGTVGIFPEGRIVHPPDEVWPFHPGAGLVISRTGAPVLLVWISGTPPTNDTRGSLVTPSRARVEFVDYIEFEQRQDPEAIMQTLRRRIAKVSGWRLNDTPPAPRAHLIAA